MNSLITIIPETFRQYKVVAHDWNNQLYGLTPEIWDIIDKKNIQLSKFKNPVKIIRELEQLSELYATIPHFKNLLAIASYKQGKSEQLFITKERQLLYDYPDYIIARCNLIDTYIKKDNLNEAQQLVGSQFDLNELYPNRKGAFTEIEIFNYHVCVFIYLLAIEDDKTAQKHLDYLEHFFPEITADRGLAMRLISFRMEKMIQKRETHKTVEVVADSVPQTTQSPKYIHIEVEIFYKIDCEISKEKLEKILTLPRETLISDMNKMLMDCINRYEYFGEKTWDEKTHSFPLHALIILSILKAEEGLSSFFTILRQSEEFLDYWFSDLLTEEFWQFAYQMGINSLGGFKTFLYEPNHYSFARLVLIRTVSQIAQHQQERIPEIKQWYQEVIQHMVETQDDNVLDAVVFTALVDNYVGLSDEADIALVKSWYAIEGLIDDFAIGTIEDIEADILHKKNKDYHSIKYDVYTTVDDFYNEWRKWNKSGQEINTNDDSDFYDEDENGIFYESNSVPYIASPKIGRNDPCPCGSGKKYKKCCGVAE